MGLKTRQNPQTGRLEVFVNDEWADFEHYRKRRIDEAYQNSIKFLRDRLDEDAADEVIQKSEEADQDYK